MSDIEDHLAEARQALADEDLHGTLAWIELHLHGLAALSAADALAVLTLYASVLEAWNDEAVAQRARDTATPSAIDDAQALLALGQALVTHKELEPALGVLARARDKAAATPLVAQVVHELCATEELLGRYDRSARWISEAPAAVRALPLSRYLFAFASFMRRDPSPAREVGPELAASPDERFAFMGRRLLAMLTRHDALVPSTSGEAATRAWHTTWTAEALIAPGADTATLASVHALLQGLRAGLAALRFEAQVVGAPADRNSQILGHAAALVLGVPFVANEAPEALRALMVVWDLGALAPEALATLKQTTPGHVLYVHAGRVDEEMPLTADAIGIATRGSPLRVPWGNDAEVYALVGEATPPRDARPLAAIAADLVAQAVVVPDPSLASYMQRIAALPREAGLPGLGSARTTRARRWRWPVSAV